MDIHTPHAEGTPLAPTFYDGPTHARDDVRIQIRFFTYNTPEGLVTGAASTVTFVIPQPAKAVWPILKDWNLWMNSYGYFWSGVIGDLEGQLFRVSIRSNPNETPQLHPNIYKVERAIPEHLLVISQPVPQDGSNGGISPGFHAYMLNGSPQETLVTAVMEHSSRTHDKTPQETLQFWRDLSREQEWLEKWRDIFIPTLKELACKS